MKRGGIFVLGLILAIFLISQISADFTKGNLSYSIGKSYNLGDAITGWVNISLNNEPTNSVLKDSFGESINLIDLINKTSNSNFVYNCNPASCSSDYLVNNEETSKTISLGENDSFLIGFNLSSNSRNLLTDITQFSFDLQSNNPETEKFPLSVDVLNDGNVEWQAYVPSGNFASSENFGCFGVAEGQANLASSPSQYCERIKLTKSAAVEIGAWVSGNGDASFDMTIKKADNSGETGKCPARVSGSDVVKRAACVPSSFPIQSDGAYFVCIKPSTTSDANKGYTISYDQVNPCGFSGTFNYNYDYNFEIFARPEKYAAGINFTLNNTELKNSKSYLTNIEQYLKNYISQRYKNNCSRGCIIPLKISSGINQQVEIKNVIITYAAGISTTIDNIYDANETPATITSKFQILYLGEAGFFAPGSSGNATFSVSLDDQSLFSDKISVGILPVMVKSLTPTTTGVKYPTTFQLILNDNENITRYSWDFGDGKTQITTTNSVTYTYNQSATYNLTVIVTNSQRQNSTKSFSIVIKPASEIVPTLLAEEQANVVQLKSQLVANFSQFEQRGINKSFNLGQIEQTLNNLNSSLSGSSSEVQFETALGQLLSMKIPNFIERTASSNGIIFYPDGNNINLDALSSISGGSYDATRSDEYKNAIFAWNEANTNVILIYNEISSIYSDYDQSLLKTFDVSVANTGNETAYIVIKNMKGLSFEEDYSQKKTGDGNYYYIPLNPNEQQKEIVFSTTDNVDFVNLPMFVSPSIGSLSLAEWSIWTPEGTLKKWILFTIIAIIIIFIVLVIWIILQIWYKRKYEKHLFKDRNNLYNLINYIGNEKKKETNEKDILAKLKKAGWTSEQIVYALKKYAGKRTGMLEIPIEKIFKRNKNTKQ